MKTIGDAYIICCGAFNDGKVRDRHEDARRVVRMGLDMGKVVATEAEKRGIDIGVRIGVHTGMVMGGVIGTVRFHFDMWGNGVVGAMKMEEMGAKGRVHISDATAELLEDAFPLEESTPIEPAFADAYRIQKSYLVDEVNLAAHQSTLSCGLEGVELDWPPKEASDAVRTSGRSFSIFRLTWRSSEGSIGASGKSVSSQTHSHYSWCGGKKRNSIRRLARQNMASIGGLLSEAALLPRNILIGLPSSALSPPPLSTTSIATPLTTPLATRTSTPTATHSASQVFATAEPAPHLTTPHYGSHHSVPTSAPATDASVSIDVASLRKACSDFSCETDHPRPPLLPLPPQTLPVPSHPAKRLNLGISESADDGISPDYPLHNANPSFHPRATAASTDVGQRFSTCTSGQPPQKATSLWQKVQLAF